VTLLYRIDWMSIITLTTDFGLADGYVGSMKGVILSIAPEVQLADLSHQIPPQNVRRAAFLLYNTVSFFPPDTVHLAVDPGVGSERRAIALCAPWGTFVGPDNGLLTYLIACTSEWRAVELTHPAYRLLEVSSTLHGRDLFAPAAAHLAVGVPLATLGSPAQDLVTFPLPSLVRTSGRIEGEVLHADRFGNLVTSLGCLRWEEDGLILHPAFRPAPVSRLRFEPAAVRVEIAGERLTGIRRIYGRVGVGQLVALVGSHGFLEVALRQGSAAEQLGARAGDAVLLRV